MSQIHPTALVSPQAQIGSDVAIGPYCVVGEHVTVHDGAHLHSHVVIEGRTTLGERCKVFPFASLGHAPQDLKYQGEPSTLSVGADTVIREYVTMQPGTRDGRMATTVGSNCLFMASSHVAHDCDVGDHVILANSTALGGHVTLEDHVIIGGLVGVHQFVHVGAYAMVGGTVGLTGDVIPFGIVNPDGLLAGLNVVGLKRHGFPSEDLHALRRVYQHVFESEKGTIEQRLASVPEDLKALAPVKRLCSFLEETRNRRLCLP